MQAAGSEHPDRAPSDPLWAAACAGKEAAREAVCTRAREVGRRRFRLQRYAFTAPEIEDLEERMMLSVLEVMRRGYDVERLDGWLYMHSWSVTSQYIRETKRDMRRGRLDPDLDDEASASRGPHDTAADNELSRAIEECLEGLPPGQRRAILARRVERLPSAQIAKKLGIASANAVRVLVHRGARKFADCLKQKGAL